MPNCSILNCKNRTYKSKGMPVKFFSFPKDEALANKWLQYCRLTTNTRTGKVCSAHFKPTDYFKSLRHRLMNEEPPQRVRTLKEDAVPSLLLADQSEIEKAAKIRRKLEVPVSSEEASNRSLLKKKKTRSVSNMQLEVLVSYMEGNKDLAMASRLNLNKEDKDMSDYLWERLASTLNCLSPGAIKDGAKWRLYWIDRKSLARRKAAQIKEKAIERGEDPPENVLSKIDQRILDLTQDCPDDTSVERTVEIVADETVAGGGSEPTVKIIVQDASTASPAEDPPPLYPEIVMEETPASSQPEAVGGTPTVPLQGVQWIPVSTVDGGGTDNPVWLIRVEQPIKEKPRQSLPKILPRPAIPARPFPKPIPKQVHAEPRYSQKPEITQTSLLQLEERIKSSEARLVGSHEALVAAVAGLVAVQRKLTDSMAEVRSELQAIRRIIQKRPEEADHDYH